MCRARSTLSSFIRYRISEEFSGSLRMHVQVIVVVTAQWDVLCYDHNLRLMWTHRVKVLVLMSPLSLYSPSKCFLLLVLPLPSYYQLSGTPNC